MTKKNSSIPIAPIIALDIGDVCVRIRPNECATELGFESLDHIKECCPEIFDVAVNLECGRISSSEFTEILQDLTGRNLTDRLLTQAWNRLIGDEIDGMAEVINEILAMNLTPIFFSNISDIHYRCVLQKLSFFGQIGGAVLSYKVGDIKPNSPIYEFMEEKFCDGGVPALYLDDREENIASAKERGWNSYQVGNVAGIRKKLSQIANLF